jgi:uncharacterized tellurite resistance protein B-like protein
MVMASLTAWFGPDPDREAKGTLDPRTGAAALLVAAAQDGERVTDIERDKVVGILMKLLHISNPEAKELAHKAEAEMKKKDRQGQDFAQAAAVLDGAEKESLYTHLWRLTWSEGHDIAENPFMGYVADCFGLSHQQAELLKPRDL